MRIFCCRRVSFTFSDCRKSLEIKLLCKFYSLLFEAFLKFYWRGKLARVIFSSVFSFANTHSKCLFFEENQLFAAKIARLRWRWLWESFCLWTQLRLAVISGQNYTTELTAHDLAPKSLLLLSNRRVQSVIIIFFHDKFENREVLYPNIFFLYLPLTHLYCNSNHIAYKQTGICPFLSEILILYNTENMR